MIEVRKKDVIFAAIVLPAAAVALYVWLWRLPAAEEMDGLARRSAQLVLQDEFPMRMRNAQERRAEAEAALAAAQALAPVERLVEGTPSARLAERQRELFALFAVNGARVVASKSFPESRSGRMHDAIAATGVRSEPVRMLVTVQASYTALRNALDAMVRGKCAFFPETLSFKAAAPEKWEIAIWL